MSEDDQRDDIPENSQEDDDAQETDFVENLFDSIKQVPLNSDKDFDNVKFLNESVSRAKELTSILENYQAQQKERYEFKKASKKTILGFMYFLLAALTIAIITWVTLFFVLHLSKYTEAVVGIVASCVTYISSLISIFLVIVKHIFPEDEEKYFNDLVKCIVEQDTLRIKNHYDSSKYN